MRNHEIIIQELQRLGDLEQKHGAIADALATNAFADEDVRSIYKSAADQLATDIAGIALATEVQQYLIAEANAAADGLRQLEHLEKILSTGTLLPEIVLPKREEYIDKIATTQLFFERYGAVIPEGERYAEKVVAAGTTAVAAELDTTDDEPNADVTKAAEPKPEAITSGEVKKREIVITIDRNSVKFGDGGKLVEFKTLGTGGIRRDYSAERKIALMFLLENQDRPVSPNEFRPLFDQEYDDSEFKNIMTPIRRWFGQLTYNRQPVILFNKKRGGGSRYQINPKFNVTYTVIPDEEPVADDKGSELTEPAEVPATTEALVQRGLNLGDLFITARKLNEFSFVLNAKGIKVDLRAIEQGLAPFRPDTKHLAGKDKEIQDFRDACFERVIEFINSDDLLDFVDSIDKSAVEYEIVNFIHSLAPEDRELVSRLLNAHIDSVAVVRGRVHKLDTPKVIDDEGVQIYPFPQAGPILPMAETVLIAAEDPEEHEPVAQELEDGQEVGIEHGEEVEPTAEPQATIVIATTSEAKIGLVLTKKEVALYESLGALVTETTNQFLSRLNPEESYEQNQIHAVVSKITPNSIASARDGRVIPRMKRNLTEKRYSVQEVVKVAIFANQNFRGLLKDRKYKKYTEKTIAIKIEQAIENHRTKVVSEAN